MVSLTGIGETYVDDTTVIVSIIILVLCACAEIWCVWATMIVCKSPDNRSSIPLILLLLSLHGTLVLRILACINQVTDSFNSYWGLYIICMIVMAKDVTTISIVFRVYNGVAALNDSPIWSHFITGTYIGLGIHSAVYYVLILLEAVGVLSKWTVIPYTVIVQVIIFAVFILGNVIFCREKKGLEGDDIFVKWMTIVLIYMNAQLLYRTVNNILVITGVHGKLHDGAESVYEGILIFFTEIVPCILISTFLYVLSHANNDVSREEESPHE